MRDAIRSWLGGLAVIFAQGGGPMACESAKKEAESNSTKAREPGDAESATPRDPADGAKAERARFEQAIASFDTTDLPAAIATLDQLAEHNEPQDKSALKGAVGQLLRAIELADKEQPEQTEEACRQLEERPAWPTVFTSKADRVTYHEDMRSACKAPMGRMHKKALEQLRKMAKDHPYTSAVALCSAAPGGDPERQADMKKVIDRYIEPQVRTGVTYWLYAIEHRYYDRWQKRESAFLGADKKVAMRFRAEKDAWLAAHPELDQKLRKFRVDRIEIKDCAEKALVRLKVLDDGKPAQVEMCREEKDWFPCGGFALAE